VYVSRFIVEIRDTISCILSRYKPSRWLNLPKEYDPNYSLLSFLAGHRSCIGKTMAITEIKAVIA
jgi:cytochrome P450